MRRAKLGVAVILSTGLFAACDAPSPPAGTVVRDAAPATTIVEGRTPATTEPPVSLEVPPEVVVSTPEPIEPNTSVDWGPVLCKTERHPKHHEPCPVYVAPAVTSGGLRPSTATTAPAQAQASSGRCGGSLPPCSVMQAESGGDPTALGYGQCSGGRTCQGKWQIDPNTAESVGYPRNLADQPESVQDDAARAILARDGCQAWSTC